MLENGDGDGVMDNRGLESVTEANAGGFGACGASGSLCGSRLSYHPENQGLNQRQFRDFVA